MIKEEYKKRIYDIMHFKKKIWYLIIELYLYS